MLASRISYVGELGWELYVPIEQGARLWDLVWEAGDQRGVVPAGIGVYGTTGRVEKCYRAFGFELLDRLVNADKILVGQVPVPRRRLRHRLPRPACPPGGFAHVASGITAEAFLKRTTVRPAPRSARRASRG